MVSVIFIAMGVFFLTTLFVLFTFSTENHNVGLWVVIMILFSLVMGYTVETSSNPERVHSTYKIADYASKI